MYTSRDWQRCQLIQFISTLGAFSFGLPFFFRFPLFYAFRKTNSVTAHKRTYGNNNTNPLKARRYVIFDDTEYLLLEYYCEYQKKKKASSIIVGIFPWKLALMYYVCYTILVLFPSLPDRTSSNSGIRVVGRVKSDYSRIEFQYEFTATSVRKEGVFFLYIWTKFCTWTTFGSIGVERFWAFNF